ncbi:acyltransferase family protein [Hymenobacter arizonensis]|uniref:Peptidoglycan/LPS O-acetylase OafA/YrhL, contains acyltransferase and SGNH-hydrolase domains n=1 Tax=Hymenobacter arizonensis TaxID=1227077 RepID=A0A1I5XXG2_HYMAR|nr:acyltransferase [Hymenobacter arizonensis]SFQ36614.1 Peptidoglycan/LPS O-acetylase OafA/YrhL, contains acyltransferase and SGNH-hydrolase domains [Hymenobacter arizonensis]
MPAQPYPVLAYRPELNGLRAVAVVIVLVQHWVRPSFPLGELGPSLFFVLSGYLVAGIIWRYDAYVGAPGPWWRRVGVFYLRRAFRILPLYYLALVGSALLPLAMVREYPMWFVLPGANLLIYRLGGWGDGVGHYWTIAVEAQFYFLWPFVLAVVGRRLKSLLALAATAWVFRVLWSTWVSPGMVHLLLPASFDLFALGAVLRLAQGQQWLTRITVWWHVLLAWGIWVGLRLLLSHNPEPQAWAVGQSIVLALADFLTVGWLLNAPQAGRYLGINQSVVQWIGRRSYGIYLFHLPLLVCWQRLVYHFVPDTADRAHLMGPLPVLLVLTPVLAVLSAAAWHLVEAPIDRFKNRFPYATSPSELKPA